MILISLAISFAATRGIRRLIIKSAPTKLKANNAVESTKTWVPLGICLTSVFAMRALAAITILKPFLTWSPALSFVVTVRLAVASVLLGLSVVSRFVGPQSVGKKFCLVYRDDVPRKRYAIACIAHTLRTVHETQKVRCSSSPLYINPFARFLRQKISVGAILIKFATPSDIPIQAPRDLPMQPSNEIHSTPPSEQRRTNPRRLQHPSIAAMFAQVIISIAIAAVVACASVVPLAPVETNDGSKRQSYLIMNTIAGTFLQLILSTLDGTSHELNPKRYQSGFFFSIRQTYMSLAPALIIIPAVSAYAAVSWEDTLICGTAALVTMTYMQAFEFALLNVLCTTPPDIKKLVEEASGEESLDLFMDVVLESVLHSNDDLVQKLISTPSMSVTTTLEREEQIRNETAIIEMANAVLYKSVGDEMGPRLESDIFRLAILTSLGGPVVGVGCRHDSYHVRNIKPWIYALSAKQTLGSINRPEPYAVPLLRSLCAYVGGLGNALMVIAETKQLILGEWLLPPGCLVCAEYAIRGATRFVLWSLSDSEETPAISWGSTHLATLAPVLLNSTYRLESGLLRYVQRLASLNPTQEIEKAERVELLKFHNPQLLPLFNICYESASLVLEKLNRREGLRRDDLDIIDIDCQKWINDILS